MDFWLVLLGFCLVVTFLWRYHDYLKAHKGFSPCQLGRTAVLALAIIMMTFAKDGTTKPWVFILIAFAMMVLVFLLNLFQAGILHGCIMTVWQALASSIVLLLILMISVEKEIRVPGKKGNGSD